MRYEAEVEIPELGANQTLINISDAYEGVEVWANDQYIGMKICPPYTFDITKAAKVGKNSLRIEVANTLFDQVEAMPKDPMRAMMAGMNGRTMIRPSGIVGKVSVVTK